MRDPELRSSTRGSVLGHEGRSLLTGTAWSGVGLALAVVLTLGVNALAARLLAPAELGAFLLVLSVGQAVSVVAELGQPGLIVRELAGRLRDDPAAQAAYVRRAFSLVFMACAAVAVLAVVPGRALAARVFEDGVVPPVVPLLGLVVLARAGERIIGDVFRAREDIRSATLHGQVYTQAAATIALSALLLTQGAAAATTAVLAYGVAAVASNLPGLYRLRHQLRPVRGRADGHTDRVRLALVGGPLVGHRLLTIVIQQSPLWIVAAAVGPADATPLGLALRIVTTVTVPLTVVNQVVPPWIAKLHAGGDHAQLERTIRLAATLAGVVAAVVVAGFALVGDLAVQLAFGARYVDEATPLLLILSLGYLVTVWVGSCGIVLLQTGHLRTLFLITVVTTALMLAAAFPAANLAGATGVAWVGSAAIAAQNVAMLVAARRLEGIRTEMGIGLAISEVRLRAARYRAQR